MHILTVFRNGIFYYFIREVVAQMSFIMQLFHETSLAVLVYQHSQTVCMYQTCKSHANSSLVLVNYTPLQNSNPWGVLIVNAYFSNILIQRSPFYRYFSFFKYEMHIFFNILIHRCFFLIDISLGVLNTKRIFSKYFDSKIPFL